MLMRSTNRSSYEKVDGRCEGGLCWLAVVRAICSTYLSLDEREDVGYDLLSFGRQRDVSEVRVHEGAQQDCDLGKKGSSLRTDHWSASGQAPGTWMMFGLPGAGAGSGVSISSRFCFICSRFFR